MHFNLQIADMHGTKTKSPEESGQSKKKTTAYNLIWPQIKSECILLLNSLEIFTVWSKCDRFYSRILSVTVKLMCLPKIAQVYAFFHSVYLHSYYIVRWQN